ncbi:MAG: methylmalonyl-CoA mutase family protein [Deltaproteobacteria bacterium]|nr:methylmalonyl-CoA mutase family protein [Candidatus Anaeroferrophillus wilburensis]MBN2888662.1 methylmalonyl-CoA mutase family protein [Deltaproteobacteria bacterium]
MTCKEHSQQLEQRQQQWQALVDKACARFPERRESFTTTSGIEMKRLFTPADCPAEEYADNIGFPGVYPFTRGVQPTMYRGRFWTMRQYAGFGSAEETNKRYKYLLENGQTGLSVAFDLPTQIGYDSDHELSEGEVGKVGVAIDTLADMETLFDGIALDKVSTSMTINAPAAVLLAMYVAVAEKQGVSSEQLRGTIQNDVLKEYFARGTYIFPPSPSMKIITDIFAYCKDHLPNWNTISISGYHIREAGSSAVQEVAFTLADGLAYVDAAVKSGLDVDDFATRLSFFFNVHNTFLEEVAKFRAARRLWARLMKERFGAKKPASMMLRFHTQTAGCSLTAQQPDNNVIRVTMQALAAVLGGTNSLHTNSRDEALCLPTEDSVRIALRTQQVIAYESGVADSIDPLAGSYLVESLTSQIEEQAMAYIKKIDDLGGVVKAIEAGYIQQEIGDSAYAYQKAVEANETVIVGVNKFTVEEAPPANLLTIKPEMELKQKSKLAQVKGGRDNDAVGAALKELQQVAETGGNLMPAIVSAVRTYASLGEICGVLRHVYGEYREL